jgi:hypothetical protein
VRDVYDGIARHFDVDRADPRVQEFVSRIIAKGYKPSEWLAYANGQSDTAPTKHAAPNDPRADMSSMRPEQRDEAPNTVQRREISLPQSLALTLGTKEGRSALAGDLDRRVTEAATYPTLALDSATLGTYRKARDAATGAIAPQATAAMQDIEARTEAENPMAANTARGVGYLSPTGPAAMVGQVGAKIAGSLGRAIPAMAARPIAGTVTGALAGGGTAAGEAAVEGAPLEEIAKRGLRGAAVGGAFGTAFGLGQAGIDAAAGRVNRSVNERVRHAYTQDAPAGARDKVVGKGGAKADRVSETIRRDPGLMGAVEGDSAAKLEAISQRHAQLGSNRKELYGGVQMSPDEVIGPILNKAAQLEQNPATRALAQEMLAKAQDVEASWGRRPALDASEVREYVTTLGRSLFKGNPNADPSVAKQVRQELYGDLVDTITGAVDRAKPGRIEELLVMNQELSDLINMEHAVEAQASRAATGPTTLRKIADKTLEAGLFVTNPAALIGKRGLQIALPRVARGAENFIAGSAAPDDSALQRGAPLLEALRAERQRDQERARMLGGR